MSRARRLRKTDVFVQNHGSLVLFTLNTRAAREWVEDNLKTESWQWLGKALAVEARYADAVIAMMEDHEGPGLVVRS